MLFLYRHLECTFSSALGQTKTTNSTNVGLVEALKCPHLRAVNPQHLNVNIGGEIRQWFLYMYKMVNPQAGQSYF